MFRPSPVALRSALPFKKARCIQTPRSGRYAMAPQADDLTRGQHPSSPHAVGGDPRRTGALARFVDAWCLVRRFERRGRIYERLGLRPVFAAVSSLFGERLPPPSWAPGSRLDERGQHDLIRTYARTRYHELVNLIALAVYSLLLALLLASGRPIAAVYCVVLMVTHALPALLERYKRARCDALLTDAGVSSRGMSMAAAWRPQTVSAPRALTSPAAEWYFAPKRAETRRFFGRLGVGAFREFVLHLFRAAGTDEAAPSGAGGRFVQSRSDLAAFDAQLRISEATHLVGMALHVPFVASFLHPTHVAGLAYVGMMLAVNLECVLLQRQHRSRLWSALRRVSQGRPGSASSGKSGQCASL